MIAEQDIVVGASGSTTPCTIADSDVVDGLEGITPTANATKSLSSDQDRTGRLDQHAGLITNYLVEVTRVVNTSLISKNVVI